MTSETMDAGKEARLAAFFAAEAPSARDPLFEGLVMRRLVLRRRIEDALDIAPLALAALALAFVFRGVIAELGLRAADRLGIALPILFAAALAIGTLWALRALRVFAPEEAGL